MSLPSDRGSREWSKFVETSGGNCAVRVVGFDSSGTAANVEGNVAAGDADSGNPLGMGGIALSSQQSAVDNLDRVKAAFNLYGEQVIAGYVWADNYNRTGEIDPLSQHFVSTSLIDTTNVSAATHYYPSSSGMSMDGYKDFSFTSELIDADGTLTAYVEATNDEDVSAGAWHKVYGYDDTTDTNKNQVTVTNGTLNSAMSFNNINYRYVRVVVVASGATNTVVVKSRRKAL